MTKEEINREICKLRGDSDGFDWHWDSNWPTLFRELPCGSSITVNDEGFFTIIVFRELNEEAYGDESQDLAELVCVAWLHWRASSEEVRHVINQSISETDQP